MSLTLSLSVQFGRYPDADAAAAEYHQVLYRDVRLARIVHDRLGRLVVGDDIDRISLVEHVARMRDDGLVVAADGHRAERRAAQGVDVRHRLARKLRGGIYRENHEREPAPRKVHVLGGGGVSQQIDYLPCGYLLRIEQVVDAQVHEHLLIVRLKVFVVVDTGDGFACAELFGEDGGDDVDVLLVVHRDEEVGLAYGGFPERGESGAVALYRHDVGHSLHVVEQPGVGIDDRYVVVAAAEHLRQVVAHFAGPRNDYLHRDIMNLSANYPHKFNNFTGD